MSPKIMGALAGSAFGLLQYVVLSMATNSVAKGKLEAEARRRADTRRTIGRFDVLIFVGIGYFAGPLIFG